MGQDASSSYSANTYEALDFGPMRWFMYINMVVFTIFILFFLIWFFMASNVGAGAPDAAKDATNMAIVSISFYAAACAIFVGFFIFWCVRCKQVYMTANIFAKKCANVLDPSMVWGLLFGIVFGAFLLECMVNGGNAGLADEDRTNDLETSTSQFDSNKFFGDTHMRNCFMIGLSGAVAFVAYNIAVIVWHTKLTDLMTDDQEKGEALYSLAEYIKSKK